jgi:drug/metabolite transporter (DMT)-like permease
VYLGVAAAVGFGLAFVVLNFVHADGHPLWAIATTKTVAVAILGGVALLQPIDASWRRSFPLIVLGGTLDVAATLFLIAAIGAIGVGLSASIASIYPVVTALLARWVLKERATGRTLVAVALAVLGIILISSGAAN